MKATLADLSVHATNRLRLAPLRHTDAEALRRLTDDPAITGSVHFLPASFTFADADALIRCRDSGRDCFLGAWGRDGETLIGVVGAHLRGESQVEIGYWIGSAFQGQGFATEATLGVIAILRRQFPEREIIAECRRGNVASWRVLEKVGFRPTGEAGQRPGRELLVSRGSVAA
ncbi:MAG TPA: GNAT family N-acetyltransferase [Acetobacteraceae bacterium]|nr:GNAT family N-acetyltransferase [Acetobacteraceae bacterium]